MWWRMFLTNVSRQHVTWSWTSWRLRTLWLTRTTLTLSAGQTVSSTFSKTRPTLSKMKAKIKFTRFSTTVGRLARTRSSKISKLRAMNLSRIKPMEIKLWRVLCSSLSLVTSLKKFHSRAKPSREITKKSCKSAILACLATSLTNQTCQLWFCRLSRRQCVLQRSKKQRE